MILNKGRTAAVARRRYSGTLHKKSKKILKNPYKMPPKKTEIKKVRNFYRLFPLFQILSRMLVRIFKEEIDG